MSNSFILQWSTNLAATGEILYGTSPTSLVLTVNNPGLSTYHYMLVPGLAGGTTYYYQIRSIANGMTVTSPVYSYHT